MSGYVDITRSVVVEDIWVDAQRIVGSLDNVASHLEDVVRGKSRVRWCGRENRSQIITDTAVADTDEESECIGGA